MSSNININIGKWKPISFSYPQTQQSSHVPEEDMAAATEVIDMRGESSSEDEIEIVSETWAAPLPPPPQPPPPPPQPRSQHQQRDIWLRGLALLQSIRERREQQQHQQEQRQPMPMAAPKKPKLTEAQSKANEEHGLSNESAKGAIKCAVCLGDAEEIMATKCGHVFCNQCICNAIQASQACPICRTKLDKNQIHPLFI